MKSLVCLLVLGTFAAASSMSVAKEDPFPHKHDGLNYYVSNVAKKYDVAKTDCVKRGGHLAIITNGDQNKFLAAKVKGSSWFGLTDGKTEGTFVLLKNNQKATYTNWNTKEPNNLGNEDCTEMYKNGKWNDLNCARERRYICQKAIPFNLKKNGYSYYVRKALRTYDEANAECVVNGGQLATAHNNVINGFLSEKAGNTRVWIGLTDTAKEKTFVWSSGQKFTYKNWNHGEPNNCCGGEDCIEMLSNGKWNDLGCSAKRGYMCQKAGGQEGQGGGTKPGEPDAGNAEPNFPLKFNGLSFYVSDVAKTCTDAKKDCQTRGGHLATIPDKEVNEFVRKQVGVKGKLWIGFTDQETEKTFKWMNGEQSLFTNWQPGEPNDWNKGKPGEDCTEMYTNGKWNDLFGTAKRKYICQKDSGCPTGYSLFKTKCYRTYRDRKTYNDALKTCKNHKASLLYIRDKTEASYFAERAKESKGFAWTGLNDKANEGKYVWTNGGNSKFRNWRSKQPDDWKGRNKKDGEDCVHLYNTGITQWNDLDCNEKHGFICSVGVGGKEGQSGGGNPKEPGTSKCGGKFNKQFLGNCYYVGGTAKTSDEAEKDCKANGGHLASIRSSAENNFVKNIAKDRAWIGYDDKKSEGNFRWLGAPPTYANWSPKEPNNCCGGEDCTEMYTNGKWNDLNCVKHKRGYICEKDKNNGKCAEGFKHPRGNSCYYVNKDVRNYQAAIMDCKTKGGYLATVDNKDENAHITKIITTRTWIGFCDRDLSNNRRMENRFYWVGQYENWNGGEPNNVGTGGEDCTEMYASGKWNDLPCSHKRKYICKK